MIDYEKFFITADSGYPELRFYVDEDDDEGELVCFVDAGQSFSYLVSEINKFANDNPDLPMFEIDSLQV